MQFCSAVWATCSGRHCRWVVRGTHAVLTGHTGIPESMLFTHLEDVKSGDTIEVVIYGEVSTYRVTTTEVILAFQPLCLDSQKPRSAKAPRGFCREETDQPNRMAASS